MIYRDFKNLKLSQLGFGTMRLPVLSDGEIDEEQLERMTDYAIKNGVNYFDTAYPYHDGKSEIAVSKVLKNYPRESYYLATKYPGHQIVSEYNPAEIFEDQLRKCDVDYFDFYLLHNVNEASIEVYLDERWGIIDYFREQKRLGKIHHLGFSTHCGPETLERFLDIVSDDMEFCQIQLNYLDWTLQNGKKKVEILNKRNIPVWIMEPVRGGKLCKLSPEIEEQLKSLRPDESIPAWGFRFLQDISGVTVILSGMSDFSQMEDNIKTFENSKSLSENERNLLLDIAEGLKDSVPCTACKYCVSECPVGLDIPSAIAIYNDLRFDTSVTVAMRLELLPDDKKTSACLGCGRCAAMCPQNIDIPEVMRDLSNRLAVMPKWLDICKEREEAAKINKIQD